MYFLEVWIACKHGNFCCICCFQIFVAIWYCIIIVEKVKYISINTDGWRGIYSLSLLIFRKLLFHSVHFLLRHIYYQMFFFLLERSTLLVQHSCNSEMNIRSMWTYIPTHIKQTGCKFHWIFCIWKACHQQLSLPSNQCRCLEDIPLCDIFNPQVVSNYASVLGHHNMLTNSMSGT